MERVPVYSLKVGGVLFRALFCRLAKLTGFDIAVWSLAGAGLHLSQTDVSLQASPSDTSRRKPRLSLKGLSQPIFFFEMMLETLCCKN